MGRRDVARQGQADHPVACIIHSGQGRTWFHLAPPPAALPSTPRSIAELSAQVQSFGRRACFSSRATAHASATGPTCPSLSGLTTERIVWIRPPSTSSVTVPATLPSRSRRIAPGWPFTSRGSTLASIPASTGGDRGEHAGHVVGRQRPRPREPCLREPDAPSRRGYPRSPCPSRRTPDGTRCTSNRSTRHCASPPVERRHPMSRRLVACSHTRSGIYPLSWLGCLRFWAV